MALIDNHDRIWASRLYKTDLTFGNRVDFWRMGSIRKLCDIDSKNQVKMQTKHRNAVVDKGLLRYS